MLPWTWKLSLAELAKTERVNQIIVEANFGDGMFTKLLQPVVNKVYPCSIREEKHYGIQKERRIIDTLEPVLNRHRLVVDPEVIRRDYASVQKYDAAVRLQKSVVYQLTRVSYERGALKHDDRLDALAMAVAYWLDVLGRDVDDVLEQRRTEAFDRAMKDFFDNANGGRALGGRNDYVWNT